MLAALQAEALAVLCPLLVKFRPRASLFSKRVARGTVRAARFHALASHADGELERLTLPGGLAVANALARLRGQAAVVFAEPNYIWRKARRRARGPGRPTLARGAGRGTVVSDDPLFPDLWGMKTGGYGVKAESAWAGGKFNCSSVYVGVIDEGINYAHPDLAANAFINPLEIPGDGIDNDGNGYIDDVRGWDFASNRAEVYSAADGDEHGTHVSGTIGAVGGNVLGVAGVCWSIKLISCKFLGPPHPFRPVPWPRRRGALPALSPPQNGGTTANAVLALDYLTGLKNRGLNIVASSNSWGGGYSRRTNAVISVASINARGALSSFSNYCTSSSPWVHLGAPGENITSTLPGESYGAYSGTSMATPHVTGAAALYKATYPTATADEVRAAILSSAAPTASLGGGRTSTGGRLDVVAMLGVVPPSYCETPCPANEYCSANTCNSCSTRCAACSNATTCTACASGWTGLPSCATPVCSPSCTAGSYCASGASGGVCTACLASCATCTNGTACASCNPGFRGATCSTACGATGASCSFLAASACCSGRCSVFQRRRGLARPRPRARPPAAVPPRAALRRPPHPPDYKARIAAQFERRAPDYDSDLSYHGPLAEAVMAAAALAPGERVLDVGAGTGLVALAAAAAVGPEGSVVGVDLSPGMLWQAEAKARRAGLRNVSFVAADVEGWQPPELAQGSPGGLGERQRFDAILCSSALPFLQDARAALAAWRGWLRPGGRVVFNTPMNSFSQALLIYTRLLEERGLAFPDPAALFPSPEAAERLLAAANYSAACAGASAAARLYAGATPESYAAAMWRVCSGFPGLPLGEALPPDEGAAVEEAFLAAAAAHGAACAVPEGISDPFVQLLVVGEK
eukprot:scaffold5.g740.t1